MNKRLGVNIDHVATVRNARGEEYPNPLKAALIAQKSGADSITIHLREDRRHIIDSDLKKLKSRIRIPVNLEMSATNEMLKIALKYKPAYVCIVPEKRQELTTEGGLRFNKKKLIKKTINILKKKRIRVSLFINPKDSDVLAAKILGADCVELHTGRYCNLLNSKKSTKKSLFAIKRAAALAHFLGLEVHAGHGLTYKSAYNISRINFISEFNIGHFIISESIFLGLKSTIKSFKKIINK